MSQVPPADKTKGTEPSSGRPAARRRSVRIVLRIPLVVSTAGQSADAQWEPVETVTVSKHGALIRTQNTFRVGDTLDILWRQKDRTARARVAWVSSHQTRDGIELGFEILDQEEFWDINFPPDRWSDREHSTEPSKAETKEG
jgi:hypothetical protein